MKKSNTKLLFICLIHFCSFILAEYAVLSLADFFPVLRIPSPLREIVLTAPVLIVINLIFFKFLEKKLMRPLGNILQKKSGKNIKNEKRKLFFPVLDKFINEFDKKDEATTRLIKKINRKNEEYFKNFLTAYPAFLILLDNDFIPDHVSRYSHDKMGTNPDNIENFRISSLFSEKFEEEIICELTDKITISRTPTLITNTGEHLEVELSVSKIHNQNGEQTGYLMLVTDITQKKRAEISLRNQIAFSKQIFRAIPDKIIITDSSLKIIFTNQKAEEQLDFTEISERNISSHLSSDSLEKGFDEFLRNVIRKGQDYKEINVINPFRGADNYVDLHIEPLRTRAGIIGSLILIKDITEWRQLTSKLNGLQESMSSLINSSPNAILSIDKNDNITLINRSTEQLFSITTEEALGKNIFKTIPSLKEYQDTFNEVKVLKQRTMLHDQLISASENSKSIINISVYPLDSEEENTVVINIEDVSEIIDLKNSLAQSQKMGSLGMLASGITHDFNNILTGIMGYTSLLNKKVKQESPNRKYIDALMSSSEKASALIKQIMGFSKKKLVPNEILEVNTLLKESINLVKINLKTVEIDTEFSEDQLYIRSDKTKLYQVIINLIINARDALSGVQTPEIKVRCGRRKIDNSRDNLEQGYYIFIEVSDNGKGIKPENIQNIFKPFFTTKVKTGTGLGLSTVKGIIQDYNGTIYVESEVNRGSTFTILLPEADNYASASDEPVQKPSDAAKEIHGTALLIDDEAVIREIGSDMLKSIGLNCITAETGAEGISLYSKMQSSISVVLLDIEMPGMSGDKVFEALRKINSGVKILIASGYSQDYLETNIFHKKIEHFIPKPFRINQIYNKIESLLVD